MALFQSYAKPGVYTEVLIANPGQTLFGNARIPVIIGEGVEFFTTNNAEIIRGSSPVADNRVIEDLSNQVNGITNTFQLTYFPVVDGTGKGIVTNDPSKITITSGGVPLVIVQLNGATGQFVTQEIPPPGADLRAQYFFKKTDTLIKNEDLSAQIPTFASLAYSPSLGNTLTIGLSIPGAAGNSISVAFTLSGTGKSDALAVSGVGTSAISIELRKADNTSVRSLSDILNLINAGIPTAEGFLTGIITGSGSTAGVAQAAANLSGGAGPQSNTVFKTHFVPIVDGTNGGVVTTNPANVTVLVNGLAAVVTAVDGQHGLVTLQNGVVAGATLTITYFTNQYQFTSDLLPAQQVASIISVGLGPNRSDFVQGVDFQLNQNGTQIAWGANADVAVGITNVNSSAVFGPIDITTTLIDEKVFLRPLSGSSNGLNTVFTTPDTPVDGSGLNRPTDNPSLISVYVGINPVLALAGGAVGVARLSGATQTVTLYNPPAVGQNVYAIYFRNLLADHTFTLEVENPGIPGQGTYSIVNENNQSVAFCSVGSNNVFEANFGSTGIVFPFAQSDFEAPIGAQSEQITLTFQDDGLHKIITPAVQATNTYGSNPNTILFTATEIGAPQQDFTGPNGVTSLTFVSNTTWGISAVGTNGSSPVYSGGTNVAGPTLGHFFTGATPLAFSAIAAQWQATHAYSIGDAIYDNASQTIQVVTTGGTTGGVNPGFSTTPGAPSTTTPDGTVVWASNGTISTSPEDIYVNIIAAPGNTTLTHAQTAALFSSPNVVNTPKAGQVSATVNGSGATLDIAAAKTFFNGGVNAVTVDYADRYLVTSSVANAGGSGSATTPATANVNASGPWTASTEYNPGTIISFTVSGNQYLARAIQADEGFSGSVSPFSAPSTVTGATTVDNEVTWKTLGPVITPVGASGYLGQTYVDAITGTKWTIVDPNNALPYGYTVAPSPAYNFRPGDTLQLLVNNGPVTSPAPPQVYPEALFTTGTLPTIAIPGVRTRVSTTFGSSAGDTATIATFKGDANEPNVGQFYYVTFTVNKTSQDFGLQLYSDPAAAYAVYGAPTVQNRASLAVQLLTGNGAQQFGVVQVKKQANGVGSDSDYEAAIQSLSANLPGTERKVNVIVPLSTSAPVQQFLSRFLSTQAGPRQKGEAIGFIGMNTFAKASDFSALANSIVNERVILVAPGALAVQITNPTTGVAIEYAVDGTFAAAALAGLNCNPANDVAQSLTNQNVVGFSRLLTILDDPTMDLMAANGVCILTEQNGGLNVRHYKTTDPENILTSEPTAVTIEDFVSQIFRSDLKQFIGRKLVSSLLGSIQIVANGRLKSLYDASIIQGYTAPVVKQDTTDPTTVRVTVSYQPIFTLLYIGVTFTVTSSSVSSAASSASGAGNIGSGNSGI